MVTITQISLVSKNIYVAILPIGLKQSNIKIHIWPKIVLSLCDNCEFVGSHRIKSDDQFICTIIYLL